MVVLGALVLLSSATGPAAAEPPLVVTDQITDEAAALGDGAAAVEEAVAELAAEDDLRLYAVFVSSFDSADVDAWAQRTAELSALRESDLLLAVAVGDSTYEFNWWIDDSSPLAVADVEDLMTSEVEPRLAAGDQSGAVVALASQLQTSTRAGSTAESAPWSTTTSILVVGGVATVLVVAHLLSRRRPSTTSSR
ncbi:TPM domain-containing protein [Geodermatophilus sp. YIM 151500]|uniref:TPM domain-containing protein n=1 Tax=Geodermatophilus sp. YIM 151500 TaxID=2984531 RepID=UPI0021E49DF1|nr:TPM domain-containing protein [Geodermatophilus sp. YIM 151500]MCV2490673.1 TPM domain-containing protein [Geodermatophilus sp. YIM 151500]